MQLYIDRFVWILKFITSGPHTGDWRLTDDPSYACPGDSCLYTREDGLQMCFCDPGSVPYATHTQCGKVLEKLVFQNKHKCWSDVVGDYDDVHINRNGTAVSVRNQTLTIFLGLMSASDETVDLKCCDAGTITASLFFYFSFKVKDSSC